MKVIGIDPGLGGAVAVVNDRTFQDMASCPIIKAKGKSLYDEQAMANLLKVSFEVNLVVLERVHFIHGQGGVSSFTFGTGYGIWLGILAALKIPYMLVTPQRWQKAMLDGGSGDTKVRAVMTANRLFPELHLKKSEHGKADALLMAIYGTRQ